MLKDFKGKTAVITGAASGIGLAVARRAAAAGMNLALADIERPALDEVVAGIERPCFGVCCDVADAEQVGDFQRQTQQRFGAAHFLFNNAGVSGGGPFEAIPLADWQWVIGVNLMGAVHVLHHFLPPMTKAAQPAHVVNTASIAGLMSAPDMAPYNVSKHGVVTLSETLRSELVNAKSAVGVSVLCPSFIRTKIHLSERNRPAEQSGHDEAQRRAVLEGAEAVFEHVFKEAMTPDEVADMVFEAVAVDRFYILTHPEGSRRHVEDRMRAILDDGAPYVADNTSFPR